MNGDSGDDLSSTNEGYKGASLLITPAPKTLEPPLFNPLMITRAVSKQPINAKSTETSNRAQGPLLGMEAKWQKPRLQVGPGDFLHVANESALEDSQGTPLLSGVGLGECKA